jgi:hypothetical protein
MQFHQRAVAKAPRVFVGCKQMLTGTSSVHGGAAQLGPRASSLASTGEKLNHDLLVTDCFWIRKGSKSRI